MKTTAIFDIGKTNKKFFLFDENLVEVFSRYERFEELEDEDGFPCDDVAAITQWVVASFEEALQQPEFDIRAVNFSAYGASFVHLDDKGKVIEPLYNYLKPFPQDLLDSFHQRYGSPLQVATKTASPPLGMLNSGLQLYWLKHKRPNIYARVRWSIPLPQYLSYVLTGQPVSDFTSIGCHTALWDFQRKTYHTWVSAEGIDRKLPPISPAQVGMRRMISGKEVQVGIGLHDSSAALIPYLLMSEEPFLLLSTGTWSIALNPYNREPLTEFELKSDCLNYMTMTGEPVKASRLFLGNEYKVWAERLARHFGVPVETHKTVHPDPDILKSLKSYPYPAFQWEGLPERTGAFEATQLEPFPDYTTAYHKLMQELVGAQVDSLKLALGRSGVKKAYVDGGFAENPLFIHLLKKALPDIDWIVTDAPFGSAIGAAVVFRAPSEAAGILRQNFRIRPSGKAAGQTH
jgi:sugar (pentulose or hexulose) kinase